MELLKANYEYGGFTYLVYSNGDIYGPTGKKLKHCKNDDGYAVVTMGNSKVKRTTQFVHRIVAKSAIKNKSNSFLTFPHFLILLISESVF